MRSRVSSCKVYLLTPPYLLSVPSMAGVADDIMIIPSSEEQGTPTHVLETSDWDSLSLLT